MKQGEKGGSEVLDRCCEIEDETMKCASSMMAKIYAQQKYLL